jgi:hypothetical protein
MKPAPMWFSYLMTVEEIDGKNQPVHELIGRHADYLEACEHAKMLAKLTDALGYEIRLERAF